MATESGGAVATESGGVAKTGDEMVAMAGDETAATGGVMYADEGLYTIDVRHVEEMETGDETGGPRDETGDKTAATAGDERDSGDQWGNVYGRRGV